MKVHFKIWIGAMELTALLFVMSGERMVANAPPTDIAQQEIMNLIQDLGAADMQQREAASRRLIAIGAKAEPQLQAATKNENALISRRAKLLLASIARREQNGGWQAFLKGDPAASIPGWQKFQKLVGDSASTREFFADMYRAEPELLDSYENNLAKAAAKVEMACLPVSHDFEPSPSQSVHSLAAYMLVAGEKDCRLSDDATQGFIRLIGLEPLSDKESHFTLALKNGSSKKVVRILTGRWIGNANLNGDNVAGILLAVGIQYELKETVDVALRMLQNKDLPGPEEQHGTIRGVAVFALGKLGDQSHLEDLNALLDDSAKFFPDGLSPSGCPEVRDLALAATVHLTGQKLKDYGFKNLDNRFKFDVQCLLSPCFADTQTRNKAFAKWQKWSKANLTPGKHKPHPMAPLQTPNSAG